MDGVLVAAAAVAAVAEGQVDVMREVLVTGGGSSFDGLAASLMRMLNGTSDGTSSSSPVAQVVGGDLGSGDKAVGVGKDADPSS